MNLVNHIANGLAGTVANGQRRNRIPAARDALFLAKTDSIGELINWNDLDINEEDLLMLYIDEAGYIPSRIPAGQHATKQQVKASGFAGAGSAPVDRLLTTDTLSADEGTAPTCSVDGTLTFSADCSGVEWSRDGVVMARWEGVNVGRYTEIDSTGNGNHLTALTSTIITERTDGSGTDILNNGGFSDCRENLLKNSILHGFVAGSPGSPGSSWAYSLVSGDATVTPGCRQLLINGIATRFIVGQNFAAEASTSYTVFIDAEIVSGTSRVKDLLAVASYPSGTIVGDYMVDGEIESQYTVLPVGQYMIGLEISIDITPGDVSYRFGVGVSGTATTEVIAGTPLVKKTSNDSSYAATSVSSFPCAIIPRGQYNRSIAALTVGCLGDSITAGDYPIHLAQMLQNGCVVDAGVAGDTTALALARISSLIAKNPDEVFVCLGLNDAYNAVSFRTTQQNYTAIVDQLNSAGIGVSIFSLTPSKGNSSWTTDIQSAVDLINAWLPSLASSFDANYINIYQDLGSPADGDVLSSAYDVGDGTHPNMEYAVYMANKAEQSLPGSRIDVDVLNMPIDYKGPLRRDLKVISGTVFNDLVVAAPLGAMFQGITEWSGEAAVDISSFVDTAKSRIGPKGAAIYSVDQDATAQARIDRWTGDA